MENSNPTTVFPEALRTPPPPPSPPPTVRPTRGWIKSDGAGSTARLKLGIVFAVLLAAYIGLFARLAQIQVGQTSKWTKRAEHQRVALERILPERGVIKDSQQLPLVFCVPRDTVIADLKTLKDFDVRHKAANELAPILKTPAETLFNRFNVEAPDERVLYLARNVEPEVAEKVKALKIRGIGLEDSYQRVYPQGSLACHLIGWAGLDGGMEGIEMGLDSILRGTPGYLRYYRDASRRLIALNDGATGPVDSQPPRDGVDVTLTIDARLQQCVEEELAKIHEEYDPKSATCIVMDVNTGAILALACTPVFDPNHPSKYPPDAWRNRIVCDFYEPGSTFKTFVAAMSLEKKIWRRGEMIDCENGAWRVGYRTLHDAHAYGILSFDDVIAKSSNIGAAKIGLRLGVRGLYDSVAAFGFGHKTDSAIPGESRGRVRPFKKWSNDSIYSVSMGHEIGTTPLQLITAYSAVVNGGFLLRPKVVQRINNEKGEELYSLQPQRVRRVISAQASAQMRDVLARVVAPGGTGLKAFLPEWQVGGKTGTTKKIDPATKQYSSTLYIGSFCGFAPANNPRLACLVTVDEPHKGRGYYGGTVACPAVREVLRKGLTLLNVPRRSDDEQKRAVAELRKSAR